MATFDENDIESWYFGALSFDESQRLLEHESTGVFLIRDSSRTKGEYVICLKEKTEVKQFPIHWKVVDEQNQYYLREDLTFPDIQSMLSFYKKFKFETTPLIRPFDKVAPLRSKQNPPQSHASEIWSRSPINDFDKRATAPPTVGQRGIIAPLSNPVEDCSSETVYVRVSKNRSPSAYDNISLRLSVGDLIEVTQSSATGQWVGILNGKKGVFPFSHVDVISKAEYLEGKKALETKNML